MMKIACAGPENEFTRAVLAGLRAALPADTFVSWLPEHPAPAADLEVIVSMGPVSRAMMRSQPQLALVQTASDGYEAVDIAAATELGVWVSYTPGKVSGNADSVAEFAVMLLIAACRRLPAAQAYARDGTGECSLLSPALMGKTVCIVGYGAIGGRVAQRLKPFGVRLIAVNRTPARVPKEIPARPLAGLKAAFAEADAVVLCVRADSRNRHLIDAEVLAAAKPGLVLVNVTRGSLVDEAALLQALARGQIGAAGLDVTEREPVQEDNPLLQLSQVLITPHIAGFTDRTLQGTMLSLVNTLKLFREGKRFPSLLNQPVAPRAPLKDPPSGPSGSPEGA